MLLLFYSFNGTGSETTEKLISSLANAGYENLRVNQKDEIIYVSLEDKQFRYYVDGIHECIKIIKEENIAGQVILIVLNNDIPQYQVNVQFENSLQENSDVISVTYEISEEWKSLRKTAPLNKHQFKTELVIYPQLYFKNTNFDKLYHIQLNIAPALETSLWKGNKITAQVILPVKNDFGNEGDNIRPGFISLSQDFILLKNWFGNFSAGNFNNNRYGFNLQLKHPLGNSNWSIFFQGGYTGYSEFENSANKLWQTAGIDTWTGSLMLEYFFPKYNLQFNLGINQYINQDKGIRAECIRHFGDKSIGFFLIYGDSPFSGGFNFAVPISSKKRARTSPFRLRAAKYFDLEYNTSTDYEKNSYFETAPNKNQSETWNHPAFIKNELIKKSIR